MQRNELRFCPAQNPDMRKTFTLTILLSILLTGCVSRSYFQSPVHSHTSPYKTIPMHADSTGSATYIGGNIFQGFANHQLKDTDFGLNMNLFRSHNFGSFQGYYGVNALVGNYDVNYTERELRQDVADPNYNKGDHFFGAVGGSAGINVVAPFKRGEWRALGAEFSYQHEYGDYYRFREKLSADDVTYVDKRDHYLTWGLNTEILGQLRNDWRMSYKIAYIMSAHRLKSEQTNNTLRPAWFAQTIQLTHQKTTGYVQLNAGTRVFSMHFGLNYRLGRR